MRQILNKLQQTVLFAILLVLPTQLGKHFWPNFSFVLGQRVDYLSPTLYISDILVVLLFVSAAMLFLFNIHRHHERNFGMTSKTVVWILLILLYLSLGIFFSSHPLNGWYSLLKLLELLSLGTYIAWRGKHLATMLFVSFSLGVIVEGALAFLEFFHQGSMNSLWYLLGERTFSAATPGIANASIRGQLFLRPYATFPHPNVLAGYVVLALCFFLVSFSETGRIKKLILTTLSLFGLGVLLLTLSRIALVVFVGVSLLFLITKMQKKYLIAPLVALYLLVGVVVGNSFIGQRFLDPGGYGESFHLRQDLLFSTWKMFIAHPLMGVGLGNFLPALPYYFSSHLSFEFLQPVHTIFLLVLAETGIVGLGVFMWVLYSAGKRAVGSSNSLHQFGFFALLTICLIGLTDHYFLTVQQGQLLFAVVLGVCFSAAPPLRKSDK